jgi:calcineurin-like phosphoesterase family protein
LTTWFTSDLHMGHKNICAYTNRKLFTTPEDHTEWLIDIWNKQVKPSDLVYHLGDFCFSTKAEELTDIIKRLNGQKIFIKGNHDDRVNLAMLTQFYYIDNWHDYKEIKIGVTKACLFHFPISAWHQQHKGSFHLHGHSHGSHKQEGKILDVGLDSAYTIFGEHRLFSEKDVLEYMQQQKVFVADNHTYREGE